MKTAAAILAAAVLLQEPDKVDLFWNPPPDRIVAISLTATYTLDIGVLIDFEAEAELLPPMTSSEDRTPTGESKPEPPKGKANAGGSFLLRGSRYFIRRPSDKPPSSLLYERGKEPPVKGDARPLVTVLDPGTIPRMKDDIKISITDRGLRHIDRGFDEPFDPISTGFVQIQLPPIPVKEGTTWTTPTDFAGAYSAFKGKLQYTARSLESGKSAKIDFVAVPDAFFEPAEGWAGTGELTYSFKDRLISSSTFTITKKNKQGKVTVVFKQVLTQKLKPK